jgi:hypothetical protein
MNHMNITPKCLIKELSTEILLASDKDALIKTYHKVFPDISEAVFAKATKQAAAMQNKFRS